jgi:hypothetical protein
MIFDGFSFLSLSISSLSLIHCELFCVVIHSCTRTHSFTLISLALALSQLGVVGLAGARLAGDLARDDGEDD